LHVGARASADGAALQSAKRRGGATRRRVAEWLRRSRDAERRARAADMADGVRVTLDGMSDEERRAYSEERLARVCARMDELGGAWSRLAVGESLSVEWTA
jgi:hypothetical protein